MSTTMERPPAAPPTPASGRGGRWIDHWDPEDPTFWDGGGSKIAKKNLVLSIFAENLGFSIWVLWTIVVINLANVGFTLSLSEQFLLIALPNLIGSALRIPYTFAVPRFGGRAWTTISASLLMIPTTLLAWSRATPRRCGSSRGAPRRPESAAATSPPRWRTSRSSIPSASRASRSGSTRPAATWASRSPSWPCRS
jgi:hypothetical protein